MISFLTWSVFLRDNFLHDQFSYMIIFPTWSIFLPDHFSHMVIFLAWLFFLQDLFSCNDHISYMISFPTWSFLGMIIFLTWLIFFNNHIGTFAGICRHESTKRLCGSKLLPLIPRPTPAWARWAGNSCYQLSLSAVLAAAASCHFSCFTSCSLAAAASCFGDQLPLWFPSKPLSAGRC